MKQTLLSLLQASRQGLLVLIVVVGAAVAAWFATQQSVVSATAKGTEDSEPEKIVRLDANRVSVPPAMAERLSLLPHKGSPPQTVCRAKAPIALPLFQGTLALDNNSLQRIHSRFAGEIVTLGTSGGDSIKSSSPNSVLGAPYSPGLKVGDRIEAGQLLAVVWSKDLGEKKSELVQAVSRLKLDALAAQRLRDLYKQNGTAEKTVLDAEQKVESDRIDVERIERTLLSWRLTEADLAKVRAEADRIGDAGAARTSAADWARVEIRAGQAGVLLEKNVGAGDIVDTTTDLFKIGTLSTLAVWAHIYEEDLHLLAEIPLPAEWAISLPSRPGMEPYWGTLEQINPVIDQNQHTALVSGRVENPKGELKIGQVVTVSLKRKANSGELTVPTEAVLEDGKGSCVFVQPDLEKCIYERRPITVLRRTRDIVYLANAVKDSVREGDRVAGGGALLLNEAMNAASPPAAK